MQILDIARDMAMLKIVDELKQRTITGDNLLYNNKTHVGEGKGNVDYN